MALEMLQSPQDPLGHQSLGQAVGKPLKRVRAEEKEQCLHARIPAMCMCQTASTCIAGLCENAMNLGSVDLAADKIGAECLFAAHPFKTATPASLLFPPLRRGGMQLPVNHHLREVVTSHDEVGKRRRQSKSKTIPNQQVT